MYKRAVFDFFNLKENMYFLKVTLFAVLISYEILAFDKSIKISNFAGCQRLLLNGKNNDHLSFPFISFINNDPKFNEILRIKFYAIGNSFYVNFRNSEQKADLVIAIFQNPDTYICQLRYNLGEFSDIQTIDCPGILNSFFYTEFTLVVTHGLYNFILELKIYTINFVFFHRSRNINLHRVSTRFIIVRLLFTYL